ncbi:MAG: RibD family protein [Pseudorhodoplanes sp.]|nr:RibD family protein [Pseudorhodoplanes sp.]
MNEFSEKLVCARTADADSEGWTFVPRDFRDGKPLPRPWADRFRPLQIPAADGLTVIGQIGQSLDGRTATRTGHSHYINGPEGLAHLHRLRALVDAVVIGVGTAIADDPQLTVRRVAGPNPARVVIDPNGRLPVAARCLANDGVRRMVIGSRNVTSELPRGIERIALPVSEGNIAPADIVAALADAGLRRILIEGGANTVSRFLAAGCLDRLHIVVAPVIIGDGPTGISLPPIDTLAEAHRPHVRAHMLGDEVLFDCSLMSQRRPGVAKKST